LPDVILLDVLMDDMDGYAVIEALKASEATKDIPVIFVTALDSTGDEAWGLSLGAADYITKPFSSGIVKLRVDNQIKAIEQLRTIERLLTHDPQTDLPNRRSFIHRVKAEWERTLQKNQPLSIIIIDVDDFKPYVKTYGHEQGDAALQAIVKVLNAQLKKPLDFAARWGGEEFVLLLPDVGSVEARETAEVLRRSIEVLPLSGYGCISVSAGVNTRSERQKDATTDDFIKEAYAKLFEAKDNGGNQVLIINQEGHSSI